ncbi:MAG: recombination mediator RecR [Clostridia bacterium]|nr:recombination mediator RecR [Clostridia bacterium]
MAGFTPSLENLIDKLAALPSVGRKSAQRLAFHLLGMSDEAVNSFIESILNARSSVHRCSICCNFTDNDICEICASKERDKSVICVVEDPRDVMAFEKTHEYSGLYHVLHGVISPMNDVSPEDICIKELISRLGSDEIKEVIMATNPTVEGEATAMYISKLIKPLGVEVSRLAYGVPVGADLEYADEFTLIRAIEGRKNI